MRFEELGDNQYNKTPDSVEKYLLRIIQDYFKDSNEKLDSSKEWIIEEAVARLKSEMDYNSLGVLSVTLPDGSCKKGSVQLSLEDFGGEPKIEEKHSAFNVDFGDKVNTACEGNDPRLSDPRTPLEHTHELDDILGLEGLLSSINTNLGKISGLEHTHNNKAVLDKIVYGGESDKLDLTILDTLEEHVNEVIEEIRQKVTDYMDNADEVVENTNEILLNLNEEIDKIKEYVIDKCEENIAQSKQYIDQKYAQVLEAAKAYMSSNYVNKTQVGSLVSIARNAFTLVGRQKIKLKDALSMTNIHNQVYTVQFSQSILDELERREIGNVNTYDIQFKYYLDYTKSNKRYVIPLPYMTSGIASYKAFIHPEWEELTISGFIKNIKTSNNSFKINFSTNSQNLDGNIYNTGNIIIEVYSKTLCEIFV